MDGLRGARAPRWIYQLLNADGYYLGTLDGVVPGGTIDAEYRSALGYSAQLTIDDVGQDVDLRSQQVRIVYDPGVAGVEPWPVVTCRFSRPELQHSAGRLRRRSVELLSPLVLLSRDKLRARFTLEEGQPVVDAVEVLLGSVAALRWSVVDSPATLGVALTWDAGSTKLEVVNGLLEAIGYEPIYCDGYGVAHVRPIVPVAERAMVVEFVPGEAAIHRPDWTRVEDQEEIFNAWLVVGAGSEEEPPIVGYAEISDPEHPAHPDNLGYTSVGVDEGVEADDQETYDLLAEEALLASLARSATITAEHAVMPVSVGDAVAFAEDPGEVLTRVMVQKLKYSLTVDGHCDAEWAEEVSSG